MIRFVIIIIFIVVGYVVFRFLTRMFKQEMYQKSERGGYRYQNWEHANTEDEYRQTLGVTADDDLATIRKKYKELLAKYHPDKVQHLGIEFQEMAERKTKVIMEAYEFFQKKHNL
jgi:DnaJ-domain-containing protein 1